MWDLPVRLPPSPSPWTTVFPVFLPHRRRITPRETAREGSVSQGRGTRAARLAGAEDQRGVGWLAAVHRSRRSARLSTRASPLAPADVDGECRRRRLHPRLRTAAFSRMAALRRTGAWPWRVWARTGARPGVDETPMWFGLLPPAPRVFPAQIETRQRRWPPLHGADPLLPRADLVRTETDRPDVEDAFHAAAGPGPSPSRCGADGREAEGLGPPPPRPTQGKSEGREARGERGRRRAGAKATAGGGGCARAKQVVAADPFLSPPLRRFWYCNGRSARALEKSATHRRGAGPAYPRAIPTGVERERGGSGAAGEQGKPGMATAEGQISRNQTHIERKRHNREKGKQIEHKSRERGTNRTQIPHRPVPDATAPQTSGGAPAGSNPAARGEASASSSELKRESLVLRADLKHGDLELAADPSRHHLLHRPGLLHGELEEELEAVAGCLAAPPRQPRAAAGQIEEEEAESSSYSQGRIEEDGDGGRGRAVLLPSSFRELRLPRAQRRGLAAGQSS
nr:unnamed protein product [Digitaria exilis]